MAASSSSSCKSLTSKAGEVRCGDPRTQVSEEAELCACDAFCYALQDDVASELRPPKHGLHGGTVCVESDVRNSAPTRKAEREKLRRDRLNEQLFELASALDPDRPKNDKSTVLADAIQTLKELMEDVERLRAEHALLVDESKDLSQEKTELHDERQQLTFKVQRLQNQVYQQMHSMLLWMTAVDPANMMGPFHGSLLSHRGVEVGVHARPQLSSLQVQFPIFRPQPLLPSPVAVHPLSQAQCCGGGAQFYPRFNYSDGGPSQGEVPPCVPQFFQGYPLHYHSPLMHTTQPAPQAPTHSQACGSSCPYTLPPNAGFPIQNVSNATESNEQHPGLSFVEPCYGEPLTDVLPEVQTTLQLQSPATLFHAQVHQNQQAFDGQDPNEARFFLTENTSSHH